MITKYINAADNTLVVKVKLQDHVHEDGILFHQGDVVSLKSAPYDLAEFTLNKFIYANDTVEAECVWLDANSHLHTHTFALSSLKVILSNGQTYIESSS